MTTLEKSSVEEENNSQPEAHSTKRKWLKTTGWIASALVFGTIAFIVWPSSWGGLFSFIIVSGKSMEPGYHTLDLVVIKEEPTYGVGDIVSYVVTSEDGVRGRILHRIIGYNDNGTFIIQGDNNPNNDPWGVPQDWIEGSVIASIPQGGKYLLWLRSPWVLAILCGIFVTWEVARIQRELSEKKQAEKAATKDSAKDTFDS